MILILVLWFNRRHLQEDEREHGKHDRLDEANEDFKEKEWEWEEIRNKMKHDNEEHLTRKDITEKTESKRDDLADFRNKLEQANRRSDHVGLMKGANEEFLTVLHNTHGCDTRELNREDSNERESQGEIQIG